MQQFLKPIILLVFTLLLPALSHAQSFADPTLSSKILANPASRLIVLYQEPLEILEIKEYRKNPEMAAWYKAAMDSVNNLWKSVVKTHWKLHSNIEFMSLDEFQKNLKSLKELKESPLVLAYKQVHHGINAELTAPRKNKSAFKPDVYAHSWFDTQWYGVGLFSLDKPALRLISEEDDSYYEEMTSKWKPCQIYTTVALHYPGHWFPNHADLVFALNNIQATLRLRAKDGKFKNSDQLQPPAQTAILKQKTLLIPLICLQSKDNKGNLIQDVPEEEVRKYYPYPFKIVSKQEIDAAVQTKDTRFAVLLQTSWPGVPGTGPKDVQFWAVDAADGFSILGSTVKSSPMYQGGRRHTFFGDRIKQVAGE
jgi:hypothetical protein